MSEFKAAKTSTPEDAMGSLTGWDRLAIKKATGEHFNDLDPITQGVATMWVLENRERAKEDQLSWSAAMGWTLGEANGFFLAPEETDPLEPSSTEKSLSA